MSTVTFTFPSSESIYKHLLADDRCRAIEDLLLKRVSTAFAEKKFTPDQFTFSLLTKTAIFLTPGKTGVSYICLRACLEKISHE